MYPGSNVIWMKPCPLKIDCSFPPADAIDAVMMDKMISTPAPPKQST